MNKFLHFLNGLVLICIPAVASAQYFEAGGLGYNVLSTTEHTVEVVPLASCAYYHGNINIPDSVTSGGITYNVVSLGERAFYRATLSGVTIPSSVTQIKYGCFLFATGLSSITVPASVTEIGLLAFAAFKMTSINVAADNPNYVSVDGMLFSKDTTTLVYCPIGKNGTITLPQSTRHIAEYAFSYCRSLTGVTVPDGLLSIGAFAFFVNDHLNNLVIPASVSHLGGNLFAGCSALNNLSIEDGNTHYYMDGKAIYSVGGDTLVSCHKSADSLFLPNTLKVVTGFNNNTSIKYVQIPEGVTTIGTDAFGYSSLESIDLPSQMQSIDEAAFFDCTSLTNVSMPTTLNTMGESVFEECKNLVSVVIPTNLRVIPQQAFYGCKKLSHITWGDSMAVVDSFAFGGCAFTELQLPPTLRAIRCGGFNGYYDGTIRHVAFSAPVDTIEEESFYGQPIGTFVLKNSVPPVATTYEGMYGPLDNADVDTILIPCGSLNAYLTDSYWGRFADKYREDCNGIGDITTDNIKVYTLDDHIVVEGADGETIRVFNALGRPLHSLTATSETVRLRMPSSGVYLVKVGSSPARKVAIIR